MLRLPAPALTDLLRRVIAAGVASLVLALSVFVASPSAHEWVHEHKHCPASEHQDDHSCAVVLFAAGVSMPLDRIAVKEPLLVAESISPETAAELDLVSPRYLRRPERGPPAS